MTTETKQDAYMHRLLNVIHSALTCDASRLGEFSQVSEDIQGIVDEVVKLRRLEVKPTAPAEHLWVVDIKLVDTGCNVFVFNDGSAWSDDHKSGWTCLWQPTTHLVAIDRIAVRTLLDIARNLQSEIIAGQVCTASLDFAIDAAKEALGVFEI